MVRNRKMGYLVRAGPFDDKRQGVLAVGEVGMAVQISFQNRALIEVTFTIAKYPGWRR